MEVNRDSVKCDVNPCGLTSLNQYVVTYGLYMAQNGAAKHAAQGTHARRCYDWMTEGRTDWVDASGDTRHYGWCGDQVVSALFAGGVRSEHLNCVRMNGSWKSGQNISQLLTLFQEHGLLRMGSAITDLMPGDIISLGPSPVFPAADNHVAIVASALGGSACVLNGNSIGGRSDSAQTKVTRQGQRITHVNDRVLWWVANPNSLGAEVRREEPMRELTALITAYSKDKKFVEPRGDGASLP